MRKSFGQWIGKKYSSILLWIDRRLVGRSWQQLSMVILLFVFLLVAVTICYMLSRNGSFGKNIGQAFVDLTNPETMHQNVYNPNQPHQESPIGLAVVYVLGAVAFTGLLIATITNIFRARSDKFRRGAVRYTFSNHVVFLGYNGLVAGMIQKLCEEGIDKVVVGVENDASTICSKIKNRLFEKYRNKVVVLQADSCNMKDLNRLRVTHAKEVYIIGEYDDAYNLRSYRAIYELYLCEKTAKTSMPQCYVNLHSQATLTLFRTYASSGELGIDFSKFHSFSFYDEWARTMMIKKLVKKKSKKKKRKLPSCENLQEHFIIAGMTEMGLALALKAALLCHHPIKGKKTIITFVDDEIGSKSKRFILQHQEFFNHCKYRIKTKEGVFMPQKENNNLLDLEFEFIEGNLSDDIIRHLICHSVGFLLQSTTIALCYDDPQKNLTMGLNMPDIVYKDNNTSVWLYQTTLGDLGYYLKNSCFKNVITFGMSGRKLDVRNEENIRRAKLINHYFLHKDDAEPDYSKQYLIDTEWEGANISERWACIRRSEFIPVLAQHIDDSLKMKDMERQRSAVDNLLFPIFEKDNPYAIQNDYSIYIATIKRFFTTNSFTFIKQEKR